MAFEIHIFYTNSCMPTHAWRSFFPSSHKIVSDGFPFVSDGFPFVFDCFPFVFFRKTIKNKRKTIKNKRETIRNKRKTIRNKRETMVTLCPFTPLLRRSIEYQGHRLQSSASFLLLAW